jgi:hypothetical protein
MILRWCHLPLILTISQLVLNKISCTFLICTILFPILYSHLCVPYREGTNVK